MTPEAFTIALALIGAITIVMVFNAIFRKTDQVRDFAEQDRDSGLAKLLEARAEVLHMDVRERAQVLRKQACDDVREQP